MENPIRQQASTLRPTWLEIDLGALARNYRRVRDLVAPRRVWCVVKADAYGHGADEVSGRLQAEGADSFAVATVDEGLQLREAGIGGRVLVMAGIEPVEAVESAAAARASAEHGLEVAVWRREAVDALVSAAMEAGTDPVPVHLKVDTGMGRLGVMVGEAAEEAVRPVAEIVGVDGARLEGVFSNLAAADAPAGEPGHQHTAVQIERFAGLCAALEDRGLLPPERHLGNSAAVLQHPDAWNADWCNGVRPGLSLYGVPSFEGTVTIPLEPVMSWHSVVAAVRHIPTGWPLGYGVACRAEADTTIAVVPMGYHDGFPRALSDRAEVLIGGRRAQVVGAISMDLTLIDITGIPEARPGAPVVLLGSSPEPGGEPIHAQEVARRAGSIAHEILCRVGARVPHRFVDSTP
jgi:alanine racemase